MDIAKLKTEITDDSLTRGYAEMTNEEVAADGHIAYRTMPKSSLSGNELFTSTDEDEFAALTDAQKQMWVSWCSTDRDPYNAANVAFVNYIFGASSATLDALAALRVLAVSRWTELELGDVKAGHVERARA